MSGGTPVRLATTLALLTVLATAAGCATYSERMQTARLAMDRGDYAAAVDAANEVMDLESAEPLPDSWGSDTSLALLERATALQAMGDYALSARDMQAAEQRLEVLDIAGDTVGRIASYIYSDSASNYRITPVEQLSLNAMNMLNYLAADDLAGAAVEARRFTVMRNYLDQSDQLRGGAMGSYLAGFVFEQLGQSDRAMRHYDSALDANAQLPSLRDPVARMAARGAYQGPAIRDFLAASGDADAADDDRPELLIVVQQSRVPHKIPERMPVGAAVGIAGTLITADTDILTHSVYHVVVYPKLTAVPPASSSPCRVTVDAAITPADVLADLSAEVTGEYERMKPRILAAAVTRVLARAVAAEGASVATGRSHDDPVAVLTRLLVGFSLVALDTPDTRSWTLLPGRVSVMRTRVAPGTVQLRIDAGARTVIRQVHVDARSRFQVVVVRL